MVKGVSTYVCILFFKIAFICSNSIAIIDSAGQQERADLEIHDQKYEGSSGQKGQKR